MAFERVTRTIKIALCSDPFFNVPAMNAVPIDIPIREMVRDTINKLAVVTAADGGEEERETDKENAGKKRRKAHKRKEEREGKKIGGPKIAVCPPKFDPALLTEDKLSELVRVVKSCGELEVDLFFMKLCYLDRIGISLSANGRIFRMAYFVTEGGEHTVLNQCADFEDTISYIAGHVNSNLDVIIGDAFHHICPALVKHKLLHKFISLISYERTSDDAEEIATCFLEYLINHKEK